MKFTEYLWYLAHRPLKAAKQDESDIYKLFKTFGAILDQAKEKIFFIRRQALIATASGKALDKHGQGRKLKRFAREDDKSYRRRLLAKWETSAMAGSEKGILITLESLGYELSYIEPLYIYDLERWSEFTVYLRSKSNSFINDIKIIDKEVMKVKPASSLPSYAIEEFAQVEAISNFESGFSKYPLCNKIVCGVWPYNNDNVGYLLKTTLNQESEQRESSFNYPLAGELAASEKLYQEIDFIQLSKEESTIQEVSGFNGNTTKYPLCNEIKTGEYPN